MPAPAPDPVLVLWDLDFTLLDPAGFGHRMIGPALAGLLGREPEMDVSFAGRTDRAILTDLLVTNGVRRPDDEVVATLMDAVADRCESHARDLLEAGGGPLPGAHAAVSALTGVRALHQGVVTGNMRRTALLKLRLCGFGRLPDPDLGAYGDDHVDRAHLVRDAIAAARDRGLAVEAARPRRAGHRRPGGRCRHRQGRRRHSRRGGRTRRAARPHRRRRARRRRRPGRFHRLTPCP